VFNLIAITLLQLIGLLVFAVFWMISSPIYLAAHACDWLDKELQVFLDEVL